MLENESASTTFPTSGAAPAPYLADTMVSEGAFLPNYYATGHASLDNYISMYSGQAPNTDTSADCLQYDNFPADTNSGAPYYQQIGDGCVFPADIPDIASQLTAAGLTWKNYAEDMGNDPTRENATCAHPALGTADGTNSQEAGDAYADRHDPAVYFHNIIDNTAMCNADDVNLNQLTTDLQSASTTPNYSFITPNLCHDGHDATCDTTGESGGFDGINQFLTQWVPKITSSPAFQQNGLLITVFDEAAESDASSCCGELPGPTDPNPGLVGEGGGRVGAVLISPCITPGTVSDVDYNHYSMLGSVENLFGLSHIGYAAISQSYFGSDIYNRSCGTSTTTTTGTSPPTTSSTTTSTVSTASPTRPSVSLSSGALTASGRQTTASLPLSFGAAQKGVTYELEQRRLRLAKATAWQVLSAKSANPRYTVAVKPGVTYQFRVRAINSAGATSAWKSTTSVIPTVAVPPGVKLTGHWTYTVDAGAWRTHAEDGSKGATYTYTYQGGEIQILATRLPAGGKVRVILDGKHNIINLHASKHTSHQIVFTAGVKLGTHKLTIQVLSGQFAIEGLILPRAAN